MNNPLNVMVIFGTRPEAIKMAPVILEFEKRENINCIKVSTSQHREMLDQVLQIFSITPDFDLQIMRPGQSLNQIVERSMRGFADVFNQVRPDLVLVQGDTTTAFCGGLAGFYERIPVGHVEAGLRSGDIYSPYPEEVNRKMISSLAEYHFAPTEGNRRFLLQEGVAPERVFMTGNTVIDALQYVLDVNPETDFAQSFCPNGDRLILVTAHRRENFGEPIRNICRALLQIVEQYRDVHIVYPVHLNRNIQKPVYAMCSDHERIHLLEPVDYVKLASLIKKSFLVLTDSGGIQEEAPALGKPVVVMRTETERPEAVQAGTAVLAGVETEQIVHQVATLLTDSTVYAKMAQAVNPYGDGKAAVRIADHIESQLVIKSA